MILPDFLTREATGEICLTGHRIGLYHIIHYYNAGYSAEMLVDQFPSLPLTLIGQVLAFYLANHDVVDTYITACCETLQQQRRDEKNHLSLVALRERFEALQQTEGR